VEDTVLDLIQVVSTFDDAYAWICVRREALTIRVEVKDLHRRPCRSRAAKLGAA
jgi:hypothetical protein